MIQLAIQEPKIEQFFSNSKNFGTNQNALELSMKQKEELHSRILSFHNDPSIGRLWNEVKRDISK